MQSTVAFLQQRLAAHAQVEVRDWWQRYMKGVIGFRGVRTADIRTVVGEWRQGPGASWPPQQLRRLAIELIEQDLTEDKLAGMLLVQEHFIPAGAIPWRRELVRWARLFDDGYIYDWNTCDWFCVRVLGPLADHAGEDCARRIAGWRRARNMWRRRAAGVAFVNLAPGGDDNFPGFVEMLLTVCAETLRSPERFAQTGTGWVLRELSKAAPDAVAEFVAGHVGALSREAVRMAVAKLPGPDRDRLLGVHGLRSVRGRR